VYYYFYYYYYKTVPPNPNSNPNPPQMEVIGRLVPQTPVPPPQPLSDKDAFIHFIPIDPRAPAMVLPRLEVPYQ